MSFEILCGNALKLLPTLPAGLAQTCVTSPPYWGLRDYGVGGQLGLERTPEEYVSNVVDIFREVRRVLKDDGTLWLNLGDCYATGAGKVGTCPGGGAQGDRWKGFRGDHPVDSKRNPESIPLGPMTQPNRMPLPGLKPKDLVGIPWRVALALQADGWWLRSDIIYSKPNPMPESVTDRPTRAHEYVFLMAKREHYYYDIDAIREPISKDSLVRYSRGRSDRDSSEFRGRSIRNRELEKYGTSRGKSNNTCTHPMGRNKRTVWTIATCPTPEAHFATYSIELAELCILAGCPAGGLVLDPFSGAATTGLAALKQGRRYLGIELNPKYIAISHARAQKYYPLLAGGAV